MDRSISIPRSNAVEAHATVKQRIIEMLQRLPDDIDYDRAVEGIYVMRRLEIGLRESDADIGTEHEEFMQELLAEDEQVPRHLDAAG
jgi:hypothetical protein